MTKAKAFLLWPAVCAIPLLAQTRPSPSGAVTDQIDPAVTRNNSVADASSIAHGPYRFLLKAPGDYLAISPANRTNIADLTRVTPSLPGSAALRQNQNQSQGENQSPAQPQTSEPATAPPASDALTWHGITLYGAYDIGVGYVTHGLPENGYNYEGASLVNRNGYQHRFLIAPNNLQQTGFGVRGKEGYFHGWSVIFNASTGINPQSGLLANASATQTTNNGLPRASYSYAIDGSRAGQPLNDEFYGGVSSTTFGALTFGRQRALGTDTMILYDPVAGGYAFSYIGYNGIMAGGGDTENARWDSAVKYRISYGPAHFGAMYKFADGNGGCFSASTTWTAANCTPESAHNNAYGFDIGSERGKLSGDIVYQHYNQAISVLNPLLGAQSPSQPFESTTNSINSNPITGANVVGITNTVYGIVTDNNGVIGAVKYTLPSIKFYAGYEYIWQNNPHDPLGVGATDQGGYIMSGVEDNNLDREDFRQIWWAGAKYTYRSKTDVTGVWYQQRQSDFRTPPTCTPSSFRASCAGTLNEGSFYLDHHFTKRFDTFAGIAYSFVTGGLAIAIPHGPGVPYFSNNNTAPTVGGRFVF